MAQDKNGYELSRGWFDFCFENPELISPNHSAIFFFAIEHCNRLGWKEKFGFPTQMTMDAIGIKKHQTYIKYFNELCDWGFFILVQKSVNQYSANIISLSCGHTKNGKALDNAFIKHGAKQDASMGQSNSPIDKPLTINNEPLEVEEEAPESNFEITVDLKKIKNLHAYLKQNFSIMEDGLKMKLSAETYTERQEAFILRNNQAKYPNEKEFRNHYNNFILSKPPPEKEKNSGQKEKPDKITQTLNNFNTVQDAINSIP